MGQPTGTIEHLCYCCGAQGGWWTCTGVEIEPAHQAEIRRQRRRAHLQQLLVGEEVAR